MEKSKFEELKKSAYEAGENDTVTEDYLVEGAQLWMDDTIAEELDDKQHSELLEEYRAGFMGQRLPRPVIEALGNISGATSWDNWEVEEVDGERNSDNTGKYWKVCEVLHCKIEHIRETYESNGNASDVLDEELDTLDQLQELLKALKTFEPNDY